MEEQQRELLQGILLEGKKTLQRLAFARGSHVSTNVSREEVLGQHAALTVADSLRNSATNSGSARFLYHRAPCSNAPLESLKKANIGELTWCEPARGRVLVVRTISTARVNPEGALHSVIEDESGAVHNLFLYNVHEGQAGAISDILPLDTVLAIKEPYFEPAMENTTGARIDHPSDMVYLFPGDPLFPNNWKRPIPKDVSESPAEHMRVLGNDAFKEKHNRTAVNLYSQGLSYEPPSSLVLSLLLNRSQAYLQLGLYKKAASDAEQVLNLPDSAQNEKALYRGARAYYELRRYQDALRLLEILKQSHPQNREGSTLLTKTKARISEEKEGKYDWVTLIDEVKKPTPRLDHADFIRRIKLDGGLLKAVEDIKVGELILLTKSYGVLYPTVDSKNKPPAIICDVTRNMVGHLEGLLLTQKLAKEVSDNTESASRFLGLAQGLNVYEDVPASGVEEVIDGKQKVDIHVIDAIREAYATPFLTVNPRLPLGIKPSEGLGLWPLGARVHLKHSCLPNASRSFLGDLLVLRACRNIRQGDTITIAHIEPIMPLEDRRAELARPPSSECGCEFCAIEEREGSGARQERVDLVQRVKEVSMRAPAHTLRTDAGKDKGAGPDDSVVKQVVKEVTALCDALDATYSHAAQIQPRYPLVEPLGYLFACYLYLGTNHIEDAVRVNARLLSALGFSFDYTPSPNVSGKDDSGDISIAEHGFYHPIIITTLLQQSSVCWQLGKRRGASSWKRIAEDATSIIAGHRKLFDEAYGNVYSSLNWKV